MSKQGGSMGGSESGASWTAKEASVEFTWPASFFETEAGRGLEPWIEALCDDDLVDATRLSLTYARWAELGMPPAAEASDEELDVFDARHTAICRLAGLASQHLSIDSVGHVGAPDLSFMMQVDGVRLGDMSVPTPFPRDGSGRAVSLMPVAFVVYQRVCLWNARKRATRAEQIVFISDLRSHLDAAARALSGSRARLTYELDPHLREFRAEHAEFIALSWAEKKNGALFDLQVERVGADGHRSVLDLNRLDPESPIIEISATEHIVLDSDVEAVARVAKKQRNKLRKHVEPHFHSPAALIPEGVSLDRVDLGAYSPRVVGFEPIKAERDFDIQSSGVQWIDSDDDSSSAFLRLFIAQPGGGVEALELPTPEAATAAVERLDHALRESAPPVIEISGKRVAPTRPLRDRIDREVSAFRAGPRDSSEEESKAKGRLAAKISDDVVPDKPAAARSDAEVPWNQLEELLLPTCELKPHQVDGVRWLWEQYKRGRSGVLLADDMGLGKTLQLAAFLALQRATEPALAGTPSLIVAPVILLENWQDELGKFFKPEVFASTLVLYGDTLRARKRDGKVDLTSIQNVHYVLTNYETLQAHQLSLLLLNWNVVILDEAQHIKNHETARARAARGLKRRFAICSTGTPVENRLGDLWSLYDFLSPHDPFGSAEEFVTEYEADPAAGVRKARACLGYPGPDSSLLRRTKQGTLSLPPKSLEIHAVPMTPKQMELERQVIARGRETGNMLAILQGLQKLYQHPRLLTASQDNAAGFAIESALEDSPKLALCLQILRTIQRAGEKALVFTVWTEMQALLAETFKRELGLQRVRIINGDPKLRRRAHEHIKEFGKTQGFDVLVLSPLAAGTGLTITAANHVIHYGRWWNPAKEDQATDRAYRIGQTRAVHVHYPLLHHPGAPDKGFDVKLHALVTKKRDVARDFLAPHSGDDVSLDDIATMEA